MTDTAPPPPRSRTLLQRIEALPIDLRIWVIEQTTAGIEARRRRREEPALPRLERVAAELPLLSRVDRIALLSVLSAIVAADLAHGGERGSLAPS